jgi:hypothetical protein
MKSKKEVKLEIIGERNFNEMIEKKIMGERFYVLSSALGT